MKSGLTHPTRARACARAARTYARTYARVHEHARTHAPSHPTGHKCDPVCSVAAVHMSADAGFQLKCASLLLLHLSSVTILHPSTNPKAIPVSSATKQLCVAGMPPMFAPQPDRYRHRHAKAWPRTRAKASPPASSQSDSANARIPAMLKKNRSEKPQPVEDRPMPGGPPYIIHPPLRPWNYPNGRPPLAGACPCRDQSKLGFLIGFKKCCPLCLGGMHTWHV